MQKPNCSFSTNTSHPLVNLQQETRCGYTIEAEMKQVWQIQLTMFQRLIDVCRAHGLRLWCDGGTLLGAIRHKGYIPWDDDIDIVMPRPDYDQLMQLGDAFQRPIFLQTVFSDEHYFRGHAQMRYDGTAAIRPSESYRKFHQGIFIDIFPIDGCPDNEEERKELVSLSRRTQKLLKAEELNVLWSGRWGQVGRKLKSRRTIRKKGKQEIYREMEDRLRENAVGQSDCWAEITIDGDKFLFPRHIFDDTLWVPFEQMEVPVPSGYDLFLRTQYGPDYMVPVHARTNHGDLILSPTTDWTELAPKAFADYKRRAFRRLWAKISGRS